MKKIFSIILAVAMLATMSVTAFAATNEGGDTSINVKGTYVAAQGAGEKISVDVIWDAMEFTYTEGAAGEWLPGEHKYADNAAGSWSTDTATITVTNHSNVAVTATLSFVSNVDGVIGTFDKNTLDLASAEGTVVADAPQAAAEFGISGAAITKTEDTLGTITVAIAANGPTVVTTEQELRDAVAQGGKIKLGDDIELISLLQVTSDVSIDLNEKTLSKSTDTIVYVFGEATVSISNGNIVCDSHTALINYGTLSIDNCTVTTGLKSLDNSAGTTVVTNSTLNGFVDAYGGTITLHDNVTLGAGTNSNLLIGLCCSVSSSSIVCYFDPNGYLFEIYYTQNVTNNNDGTWTVTKKAE